MKRSAVDLEEIADLDNLAAAFWLARRGTRQGQEVERFAANLDAELALLRQQILTLTVRLGDYRSFHIHDPKPRAINAPVFRERVLHQALMTIVGPVLDRALVADTFACRTGKGALAAVLRAQQHLRRFRWYVKVDIRSYFRSISHGRLKALLARRLKGRGLLALCDKVIASYEDAPGQGLPIGALTSQHFANYYLAGLDRHMLEVQRVRGMVRYMDDVVVWTDERAEARAALEAIRDFVSRELSLAIKGNALIGGSEQGLTLCGFRIHPGTLRLSRRRKRRYCDARARWEAAYAAGRIDSRTLQAGYAAALAVTAHADACSFRREQLCRVSGLAAEQV